MGKKMVSSLGLGFFVIAAMFFSSSVFGQTKPVELTYSIFFPATHRSTGLAGEWAKEIEKRTNGAVKITMFPGGTLTPASLCYDGVVKGLSDIGTSNFGLSVGRFPMFEGMELPLGWKSATMSTKVANLYYKKFKPKELDDVKVMYLYYTGPGIVHTRKPVNTLEDLKGMKIRSQGFTAKIVTALGGAPVAMPMGEAYDAISRGVAEGYIGPYEALAGFKLAEVIKCTTENFDTAYVGSFFVVMNKKKWDSLSQENQKIIEKINEEWIGKTGTLWDELDKEGKELTLKRGNKIIALSKEENAKWRKAVDPIIDEYVKSLKSKGLPGEEAVQYLKETIKSFK